MKDFVGVLRGRLEGLSITSDRKDIIFAVQNVHAISRIVRERLTPTPEVAPKFMAFLLSRLRAQEEVKASELEVHNGQDTYWLDRDGVPNFQVGQSLRERTIQVDIHVSKSEERKVLSLSWEEFFDELVRAHGDEPLVSPGRLRFRFDVLEGNPRQNRTVPPAT